MTQPWVRLGVVARAHGLKGGLRLKLDNVDGRTLRPDLEVRLGERPYRVARYAAGVLTLVDIADKDAADALRGQVITVRRSDFADNDLYLIDLIGAPVVLEDGTSVGTVKAFSSNGAQALIEVARASDVVSVPFVSPIVVSSSKERIVLRPPPGLLDADAVVVEAVADAPDDDAPDDDAPDDDAPDDDDQGD